ncbi:MAG: hypothetical protein NT069_00860 [Planctomycetota bacterium]|nr:hypothetical protein [Planctomycetota bacterium]
MQDAIAFFSLRLITGIGLMLLVMPRQNVTSAFFRILLLVCLGLGVVATLTTEGNRIGPIALCVTAFVGSVLWLLERRPGGTIALLIVTLLASYETIACGQRTSESAEVPLVPLLCSTAATVGTLGGAMAGMLLGHRYLTAPGMPLAPLLRLNNALGIAGLARLAVSGWMLGAHWPPPSGGAPGTWLALRWLAGVVGPLVVWIMVKKILRYRNTQSATGVLFVGVILTFLGELSGDLLVRAVRIPY